MTTPSPEQKAHPVLWAVGAVILAVVVIIVLGSIKNPDGDPIIRNPESLITQILITAGVIGAATLPLLIKTQRDAAVAKDQLANDHIDDQGKQINLRVEQDERHHMVVDLVTKKFEELTRHFNTQIDGVRSDIRGIRYDVGRNTNGLDKIREKLDEHLEESREVIAEFKTEIGNLHENVTALEDTQVWPLNPEEGDTNGNPR